MSQSLNPYDDSGVLVRPPELGSQGRGTERVIVGKAGKKLGKKSTLTFALAAVIACAVGGAFWGSGKLEEANGKAVAAQKERDELRSELMMTKNELASLQSSKAALDAELSKSQASLLAAQEAAKKKQEKSDALETKLKDLLSDGEGQLVVGKDGSLTLQMVDRVLFKSGEAELSKRGQKVMAKVGKALLELKDKQVWVQGHTDDVPVRDDNPNFTDNWDLSAARAINVVHYLQDVSLVEPSRLAAAAFGSHRPISKRKKARNRRIEIVLFPRKMKLRR